MTLDRTITALDGIYDVLSHPRRRAVLRYLRDRPAEDTSVDDLVTHLRATNGAGPAHAEAKRALKIDLYHRQLPKLADHGLVDYEAATGRVAYVTDDATETLLAISDER